MINKKFIAPCCNTQIGKRKLKETYLYTLEMMLDESENLKEAKERIMFQIMQDMIIEEGSYVRTKNKIDGMFKKLKDIDIL